MLLRYSPCALVFLAACGAKPDTAPPASPPQEAAYTATDFAFAGPDTLAPGMTRFTLTNKGTQEHHFILARLDDGKTVADVMASMQKNPNVAPDWLKFYGAAGAVETGGGSESTVDLPAGNYLAVCFLTDPTDMKAHVAKGMMKQITVTGAPHAGTAPKADMEVKLADFSISTGTLTGGPHVFHLTNTGTQAHEAQLIRLNDGTDAKTFLAAFAPGAKGPPPGKMMGGSGALSPGKENYWSTELAPGHYLMVCFVPDSTGTPHIMKGMVTEFTVSP